jgi:hypothetical protein
MSKASTAGAYATGRPKKLAVAMGEWVLKMRDIRCGIGV